MALPNHEEVPRRIPNEGFQFEQVVPEKVRKVHESCRELRGIYGATASQVLQGLQDIRKGLKNGTIKREQAPELLKQLRPGAELMDSIKEDVNTLGRQLQEKGYPIGSCHIN